MITRAFVVPKTGASADECQDAFAINRLRRRFSVADGMSDSAMSGEWAALLATKVVELANCDRASLRRVSSALVEQWRTLAPPADKVPWYLAAKLAERGAYATLVTLDLAPTPLAKTQSRGRRNWKTYRMLAIGDACVFHVRGNRVLAAHPYSRADNFLHRPIGLGTTSQDDNLAATSAAAIRTGIWRRNDRFLLMSDALAAYFVRATSARAVGAAGALPFARNQGAFETWVEHSRQLGVLKDDDTTLVEVIT